MAERLRLLAVHAHPDDEATGTGGILAKYSAEGDETVLVTCTGGEVGEISDPALATPENLASVRAEELNEAVRILGISAAYSLGYRDSGMAGTEDNEHPESFNQANFDDATGRLVEIVRRHRPQVLVTYDANGFYGHPDHIMAHRITMAAFDASGDPARYPEHGLEPWTPSKVYATAIPHSAMREFARRLRAAGIEAPFDPESPDPIPIGVPDEEITTVVDVGDYVDAKRAAMAAHRTQLGPESFFMKMPPELFRDAFGRECFIRLHSRVDAPAQETELFAGLRT